MKKKQKKYSTKKYWVILILWIFLPFILEKAFNIQVSSKNHDSFFVAPYSLFIIFSFVYEYGKIHLYLSKHYPDEVRKRRKGNFLNDKSALDYNFILSFSPTNDNEWKEIQVHYKRYYPIPFISIGAVILFSIIHTLF